jgi:hypothetical protein
LNNETKRFINVTTRLLDVIKWLFDKTKRLRKVETLVFGLKTPITGVKALFPVINTLSSQAETRPRRRLALI